MTTPWRTLESILKRLDHCVYWLEGEDVVRSFVSKKRLAGCSLGLTAVSFALMASRHTTPPPVPNPCIETVIRWTTRVHHSSLDYRSLWHLPPAESDMFGDTYQNPCTLEMMSIRSTRDGFSPYGIAYEQSGKHFTVIAFADSATGGPHHDGILLRLTDTDLPH